MDVITSRQINGTIITTKSMQQVQSPRQSSRSLREYKRDKIAKKPEVDAVPEVETEAVEERLEKSKIPSRPTSSDSLRRHHHPHNYINHSFIGSNQHIHRSTSTLHSTPIVHEQYCSCCRGWSRREKVLLLTIACLIGIICGLFISVGVLVDKQSGNNTNAMWFTTFRL